MRIAKGVRITLLAALTASAAVLSLAQTGDKPRDQAPFIGIADCPTVTVSCYDTGMYGEPVKFVANIAGADPAVRPTYKWTVPGFHILSGAGTSAITVEPPAQGGTVVATVEIGGYDRACTMTASCTTSIIYDPGPRKIDEYGNIAIGDEKQRLDQLTDELRNDPMAEGYLICYGGRRSRAYDARRRCERAKNFLIVSRGITADRLVTVDGGYREGPAVELWLVPSGVVPPAATPTVDPSEVRPSRPPRMARPRARR